MPSFPPENQRTACALCALRSRRSFTRLLALGAAVGVGGTLQVHAQSARSEGLRDDVGSNSQLARLVPADWLEGQASGQYQGMMRAAAQQQVLAGSQDPQLQRLRHLAQRIVPFAPPWNKRAPLPKPAARKSLRWRSDASYRARSEGPEFAGCGAADTLYDTAEYR